MKTGVVLGPFGADLPTLLDVARRIDRIGGFDRVWTNDHFAGGMLGAPHVRDPFVTLGAIAASTERVGIGLLVANMMNRHPAQLAVAVNSLANLAPGRVICGIGAGAAPGSRFAVEQQAIGRRLLDATGREQRLIESIEALRAIWRGDDIDGEHVTAVGLTGVVDAGPLPSIIVGATGSRTIAVAMRYADGVNIRSTPSLERNVATAVEHRRNTGQEISVLVDFDADHPLGGDPARLEHLDVDRRVLHVPAPFPLAAIERVATRLAAG